MTDRDKIIIIWIGWIISILGLMAALVAALIQ